MNSPSIISPLDATLNSYKTSMLSVPVFQFYEAQVDVIAQGMPTCVVTFIEYGNTEEVFLQDIRPCLPQMVTSTFQIIVLLPLSVVC